MIAMNHPSSSISEYSAIISCSAVTHHTIFFYPRFFWFSDFLRISEISKKSCGRTIWNGTVLYHFNWFGGGCDAWHSGRNLTFGPLAVWHGTNWNSDQHFVTFQEKRKLVYERDSVWQLSLFKQTYRRNSGLPWPTTSIGRTPESPLRGVFWVRIKLGRRRRSFVFYPHKINKFLTECI